MRKAGFAFAGMVAVVLAIGANAAEDKVPAIKTIMKAVGGVNKEKGLCAKCSDAAKAEKWDEAQKLAKSLTECCANLPKNKAPKGDMEKWEKLTKDFAEQGEAIKKAADAKDLKEFDAAVGTFVKACGTCHMEFKGKKGK